MCRLQPHLQKTGKNREDYSFDKCKLEFLLTTRDAIIATDPASVFLLSGLLQATLCRSLFYGARSTGLIKLSALGSMATLYRQSFRMSSWGLARPKAVDYVVNSSSWFAEVSLVLLSVFALCWKQYEKYR